MHALLHLNKANWIQREEKSTRSSACLLFFSLSLLSIHLLTVMDKEVATTSKLGVTIGTSSKEMTPSENSVTWPVRYTPINKERKKNTHTHKINEQAIKLVANVHKLARSD